MTPVILFVVSLLCWVQIGSCVLATSVGSLVLLNVPNQVKYHIFYFVQHSFDLCVCEYCEYCCSNT